VKIRPVGLPDPDPWLGALTVRPDWLAARLPYDARKDDDLRRRARRVDAAEHDRAALAAAAKAQVARFGGDAAALAAADRLADPRALVVVTGQQTGALLGPLFTLAKAAGAVAHAAAIERVLERPVVPVFWAATEDHDVGEINRVRLPAAAGGRQDFHLFDPVPPGREPVGPRPIRDAMSELLAAMRRAGLPAGPYRDEVLDLAQSLVATHPTLGGHFCALLNRTFSGTGLVVLDPMDPPLRRLGASVVRRVLENPAAVATAVSAGIDALAAVGRTAQVAWRADEVGVFALVDGQRLMLLRRGDRLEPRDRPDLAAPAAAWAERAEREPEAFSPNVLVRPVVQDRMLPVAAVVLGPGETHYFAQLRELFELLGEDLPPVLARPRLTLVNGTVMRLLRRLELDVEGVLSGWQERLQAELQERDRIGIEARFAEFSQAVESSISRLVAQLGPLGPAFAEMGEKTRQRLLADVGWLKDKAEHAHRQGNDTLIRQYHHVGEYLVPEGGPQDRSWTSVAFLVQHGLDLGAALARQGDIRQTGPLVVDMVDGED
jgi:bacillithiol biosynthesis cysteine-adding enzyme BshC